MTQKLATQRIDTWLWYARFYKSRSLAAKMVRSGKVRVNGNLCKKSSSLVTLDDVLTFVRADEVLIAKILDIGIRRGPAPEARLLYEDLTPPKEVKETEYADIVAPRVKGSGRPTKAERRALDRLIGPDV